MKSKVGLADDQADILAREQSKNKLLSQCVRNGRDFKYNAPLSSEDDVNMMFAKIQKLSEEDQLSLMRKKVKFKKMSSLSCLQTLCSSSSTTFLHPKCTKTGFYLIWHYMLLIQLTKKSLLRIYMKSLMPWPHYPLLSPKNGQKNKRSKFRVLIP